MVWRKSEEERSPQKGRSHNTEDGENSTVNSEIGKNLTNSSQMHSALYNDFGMHQTDITKSLGSKTSQTRGPGWDTSQEMISDDLLFHLFPTFAPIMNGPKSSRP